MGKNRSKTSLIHVKGKDTFEISKEKSTGKLFIKGSDVEIPPNKVCRKNQNPEKTSNYDYSKPYQAQELGEEWDNYAWGADDF